MSANAPGAAQGPERTSQPLCLRIRSEVRAGNPPVIPRAAIKKLHGWASSLALHGVLLLILGVWSVSTQWVPSERVPKLETRLLAGSEMGVEDGLTTEGGLNTPLELTAAPAPAPEPTLVSPTPLDVSAWGLEIVSPAWAALPSGGGGIENPHPGAGNGQGSGLARRGAGGEDINGVTVQSGDPQFTLLWDSEADLDLHVIEPGGKEIYWEDPDGAFGGALDVDNFQGFGPENVYWLRPVEGAGRSVPGPGPPGVYKWFVVYAGAPGGVLLPTQWKVRIKHAGKVSFVTGMLKSLNERSRVYPLRVEPRTAAASEAVTVP